MRDPDPRAPLFSPRLLGTAKVVLGLVASGLALCGGLLTFCVAGADLWAAVGKLAAGASDLAIVAVVKSVDALLLGLVQFLLAAFLWQILDPKESLLDDENLDRLEEAKEILCKVVLVIVAVRMLGVLVQQEIEWQHLVYPAGIVALALATSTLGKKGKAQQP